MRIDSERVHTGNDAPEREDGRYVLYWMQQSQRASANPALDYAIAAADRLDKSVVVAFGLDADYPEANHRHFAFMLEGLAETAKALGARGIKLIVTRGRPDEICISLAGDAALVVFDRGYLRHQRQWRSNVAESIDVSAVEIEGDIVVPVETASDKREWAARTIRSKIGSRRDEFIALSSDRSPSKSSLPLDVTGDVDIADWRKVLHELEIDRSVPASGRFEAGTDAARSRLTAFLRSGLKGYADSRNDPAEPCASELSPYLHFGQLSPVEVAARVLRATGPADDDKKAFLEELIVRRELAINYVWFTDDYDRYAALPDWARKTLAEHAGDERPHRYTRNELEEADTHDRYWNAAMREMLKTGYMHNYMRMYWGKKILEWSNTPEYAYRTALYLNNKYFLDGRDPNSYANVGWLFGLHDRAWTEREIFGKVRYMNSRGLESKFDIDAYVRRIEEMQEPSPAGDD